MAFDSASKRAMNGLEVDNPLKMLVEITHTDLATPIRLVDDNANATVDSVTYYAIAFDYKLPDQSENSQGRASVTLSGIDGSVIAWLRSSSNYGQGATLTMKFILMDDLTTGTATTASHVQQTYTFSILKAICKYNVVTLELGKKNLFDDTFVKITFRPPYANSIF